MIVLVAKEPTAELLVLIDELLGQEGVSCDLSRASRFDESDLFANADGDATVRVFIRLEAEGLARMYFRGPGGERFLIRKVALPRGLDAVGRELVAQVVESSVVALLRSPVGLSRQQASDEVARDTSPPDHGDVAQSTERALPAEPVGPAEPEARSGRNAAPAEVASRAQQQAADGSPALLLTLFYGISFAGPDFYLANGPGLEIGLALPRTPLLRARLSAQHLFQKLRIQELTAHADTNALRLCIDVGVPVGANARAFVGLGGGIDLVNVDPGAPHVADVQPADAHGDLVPVLRAEFRYEIVKRPALLGVAAFADFPLLDTHYDLDAGGTQQPLAVPWHVRPGAVLAVGLHW